MARRKNREGQSTVGSNFLRSGLLTLILWASLKLAGMTHHLCDLAGVNQGLQNGFQKTENTILVKLVVTKEKELDQDSVEFLFPESWVRTNGASLFSHN